MYSKGNVLTYDGYTYEWSKGRELSKITNGSNVYQYKYNDEGIRISKTINGVETKYYIEGNKIVYETKGTDTIYYYYDNDNIIGFKYNDINYYYEKNIQNDIIGIIDEEGNKVVQYEYDSWGKILSVKDGSGNNITDPSNIGLINPFRYRGYYYDSETGLYYLQSRYYNPEIGRFLNTDDVNILFEDQGNIIENNLYAYTLNNPINMVDDNGDIAWWITAAVGGALIDSSIYTITSLRNKNFDWKTLGKTALRGAVTGVAISGVFKIIGKVASGVTSTISKSRILNENTIKFTKTVSQRLNNSSRYVPIETLKNCIKSGIAKPDPQGTRAIMYYSEMWKNGKKYTLEVLYDKVTNTIQHFLYK